MESPKYIVESEIDYTEIHSADFEGSQVVIEICAIPLKKRLGRGEWVSQD